MPDKRQQSKQRRAARNRANRDALAARRENAELGAATRAASADATNGSSGSNGTRASRSSTGSSAARPTPVMRQGSESVGRLATGLALAFAVAAAAYVLFADVSVDARGEPWPRQFAAVAKLAQARSNDGVIPDESASIVDAYGPAVVLMLALPVVVAGFAVWAVRRPNRSRLMTFAMLAMAGAVILNPIAGMLLFPSLIALAVAGFRVRKADLPARVAERATAGGAGRGAASGAERPSLASLFGFGGARGRAPGRGRVIDAEAREEGDDADDAPADDDALAELEAEVQAEIEAERDTGDEGGGGRDRPDR